jgi:coproporphyrinogen III oxidase-like Fe-S oxidoreductase
VRSWNVFRWEAYRRALKDGASVHEDYEVTGAGEIRLERLWLAFRTNRGLSTTDPLWQSAWTSAGDLLEAWSEAGWVVRTGDSVRLSASGWLRMDELVAALGARMQEERKDTGSRDGDGIRKTDRT